MDLDPTSPHYFGGYLDRKKQRAIRAEAIAELEAMDIETAAEDDRRHGVSEDRS